MRVPYRLLGSGLIGLLSHGCSSPDSGRAPATPPADTLAAAPAGPAIDTGSPRAAVPRPAPAPAPEDYGSELRVNRITDPRRMSFRVLRDTLYRGDTLTVLFKVPHAKDFAIVDPDDHFYFVVYQPAEQDSSATSSLVDWESFARQRRLQIITDQTKISPYEYGAPGNRLVFTKTGRYELRLSEMLGTDDGTPMESKIIYYIHRPRLKR